MIVVACRSLVRVDLAWKFTNTYVVPNPSPLFQRGCCLFHGLNYNWKIDSEKDMKSVMDRKKKKTVTTPVWRPVCTHSSSHEECLVKDAKVESGNQHNLYVGGKGEVESLVAKVHCRMSSSVSYTERAHGEAAVVNELVNSNISSTELQGSDECRSQEGGSVPSTEKHTIRIEAAASLIRFIKGKESSTQKKIEEEMGVKIIFPSSKKEDYIIIEGISGESVVRASEKIQVVIDEAIKSPSLDYSHFVSLPLAIHPQLVEKLVNFQNSILRSNNANQVEDLVNDTNEDTSDEEEGVLQLDRAPIVAVKLKSVEDIEHVKVDISNIPLVSYPPRASKSSTLEEKTSALSELGIDKSIFIKPNTFHLTVLMLKLYNKDRVDVAAEVLRSVSSKVMDALDGWPATIRLKGLKSLLMHLLKLVWFLRKMHNKSLSCMPLL